MLHKTLLGLTGLALLTGAVVAPWLLHTPDSRVALAAEGQQVLLREVVARDADLRAPLAPDFGAAREPVVTALDGVPERSFDAPRADAVLSPDEQKQVDKLDKKLAKAQAKLDKLELKQAELNDELAATEAALDDADNLPETTDKELKAKAKLLAKLQKKLLKLQAKLDKGEAKLEELVAVVDDLDVQITVIDPEHFADIPGLQAPEQMSVVTVDDEQGGGGSGLFGGGDFLLGGNDFPLLSDFNLDPQHHFVYDPSMQTLGTVNMILCLLSQTAYDEMVNGGTYVAQIDESTCESGSDSSSSGSSTGQSSGGNAEAPSLWVVKSSRPSEDGSQTVKFWVPDDGDGGGEGGGGGGGEKAGTIRGLMEVTKGISDTDPFGAFNLNFARVPVGGEVADATNFGNLRTLDVLEGFIGFSFFETEGDLDKPAFLPGEHAQVTQANVNMFDDQSQGVARIRRQSRQNFGPEGDTGVQTEEYLLAFNDQTVLRAKDGDEPLCLSRTDFAERVFRYGLYEAQGDDLGARVDRNGGFGFKTAGGQYGWIGYYGMWTPSNVSIENGDVVTKSVFGGGEPTQYTVLSAPGKLIRNTRQQLALEDADGAEFTWWDFPAFAPPGGGGGDPPPGEGGGDPPPGGGGDPPPGGGGGTPQGGGEPPAQYRVNYDHPSGEFRKVASFDNMTGQFSELETPEAIDIEAEGNFLQMFSESLGGQVSYVNGEESLTYFTRQFVTGSDELFEGGDDVTLLGFQNCLAAGISSEEASLGQVFLDPVNDVASPHHFVFRKSDLTLYHDADGSGTDLVQVGLADGAAPTGGPFTWGMNSGPMLTSTEGLLNTYETFKQEVFFTYETGHNSWNKYQSLVDGDGNSVVFDPPLQFTYTHSLENDRNGDGAWAGKKFLLEYNGPGDMHGIPGQPFDLDGDGNPDRYYPVFSIADGALCGPTGTEYVIKALDVEQSLQLAGPGGCSNQTTGPVATLPLPDLSAYTAPDVGPKPYVTDPPAVIEGEVVETESP